MVKRNAENKDLQAPGIQFTVDEITRILGSKDLELAVLQKRIALLEAKITELEKQKQGGDA